MGRKRALANNRTRQSALTVMLVACVEEVTGLNKGWDTNYNGQAFASFCSVPADK
jgi:hypothetical protein